jgi:ABC-2 type transport system permease protein
MLAYLVIVFMQVLIIFGVGNVVFNMPLGESYLGLLLVTLGLGLAATGMGIMVAALAKTDRQADSIGMVLAFVLAGLGGCIPVGLIPIYESGGAIEIISRLTPHAHALMGFRDLMLKNANALEVLPQVGILLVFALIFYVIAVWRFKYD